MSNLPPWFLQAIDTGTVDGGPIPKWFQKEVPVAEISSKVSNFMLKLYVIQRDFSSNSENSLQ